MPGFSNPSDLLCDAFPFVHSNIIRASEGLKCKTISGVLGKEKTYQISLVGPKNQQLQAGKIR
jgi:hypothetical protein